jgi:hypothetical protein
MVGERMALIVAVDHYRHPGLAGLASPAADADALANALADPERGDFHVDVIHNEDSYVIAERVEALLMDRALDDVVLLHFSCHGMKDPNGELYLAAANTRPDRLASTAVDAAMVNRLMRRSRAKRVVLLLDCCYGGAFERGVIARAAGTVDVGEQFAQDSLGGGRGRVVITASSAVEYAFEGSSLTRGEPPRPSYFTGAVVEGIVTGKADRDNDGRVSLGELYDYVYDRVREQTPEQTPGKWEFGTTGELFISRNPSPAIIPAKMPDTLLELIDHPHPAARLSAVQELAALASGERLGVALGAVQVLHGMLVDDSRRVAAMVEDVLNAVAPQVSETAVDFGTLVAGSAPPVALLTVSGPPLTQSFTITTSPTALAARKDHRTVHLTLDTAAPARIQGQVTIDSPTGTAIVAVTAVVTDSNTALESSHGKTADVLPQTNPETHADADDTQLNSPQPPRADAPPPEAPSTATESRILSKEPITPTAWRPELPQTQDSELTASESSADPVEPATVVRSVISVFDEIFVPTIDVAQWGERWAFRRMLQNCRSAFSIPPSEEILGLIDVDFRLFGNAKKGVIFAESGVYVQTGGSVGTQLYMPYVNFPVYQFELVTIQGDTFVTNGKERFRCPDLAFVVLGIIKEALTADPSAL